MEHLINKLGQSLKNTCKEALDQSHKTVDQAKYRAEILSLQNELKKLYQQLGEAYYTDTVCEEETRDYQYLCSRITGLKKEITRLEEEITAVTSQQKDGFKVYKQSVKDTWCESTQKQGSYATYQEIKVYKFCKVCNIGNAVDAEYCVHCGEKL